MIRSALRSSTLVLAVLTAVGILPAAASAQPAAAAQFAEAVVAPPAETTDDTVWTLGLNGAFNYGNARSLQIGANTHFLVRRDMHMFTMDLNFNYQSAALRDANGAFGDWNASAQNFTGKIRYDVFLDADDGLFVSVSGLNNPFAGLDFRFQGQFGYSRNLFSEAENHHRLWFEVGGDVTYDDRFPNPLCAAPPMGVTVDAATCTGTDMMSYLLPGTELQPSARLYLGYDNHMNEQWSYRGGVEGLVDLRGAPHWGNVRLNWMNTFTLNVGDNLAVNFAFNFLFDGEPVPGRQTIDTLTTLGVTYTML